jgi:hypothetical protein
VEREAEDGRRATRTAQRGLEELRARKAQLVDAFLYRQVIDRVTYQDEKDRPDQEIALAKIAAHEARLEEMDVEAVVAFAEHVLTNAARLWREFSLEQSSASSSFSSSGCDLTATANFEPWRCLRFSACCASLMAGMKAKRPRPDSNRCYRRERPVS